VNRIASVPDCYAVVTPGNKSSKQDNSRHYLPKKLRQQIANAVYKPLYKPAHLHTPFRLMFSGREQNSSKFSGGAKVQL